MAKAKTMEMSSADGANVPALVITPGKAPVVAGNFDEIRSYLAKVRDKYTDVDFSSASIEDLVRIKKEMQVYRTSVEKIEKTVKSEYFNNPKKVFEGCISGLYTVIAEVEVPIDAAIAADDQKRIDGLAQAIDGYIAKAVKENALDDRYAVRFERKKGYYNKTAVEKDIRADIEAQAKLLSAQQKAETANIKLIKATCAKDKRLSEAMFLELLDGGQDVATILERIEMEVTRLAGVNTKPSEPVAPADTLTDVEPMSIADECDVVDFNSDLPKRTKTVLVEITYPADCGDSLTELFERLHERGIKSRVVESK